MNLSDAEIIKAFECCYLYDVMFCDKCPNKDICDEIDIGKSILDLINRLKAENKNCGVKIQNQREQLKATNEKIKELSNELREAREDAEKSKQMLASLLVIYDECEKVALKEFAERLNEEAEKVDIDREGDFVEAEDKLYYTVANWCKATTDNLLKEMG
jgi:chromosome segregation ATPase